MAHFVLVHGAFSGAWIWGPLSERLQANGHTVQAFDLPCAGDDHRPVSEATLDTCAERLCEVLTSNAEPAIVVGNSMGGVIATQGAARCPGHVKALVYVAAFIPRDGQSLLAITQQPEGADDQVQANITVEGEPPVALLPDAAAHHALYGCCTDEVAAWAIARKRPQPVAPFVTPVSIPAGALDGIERYYVMCTRDRSIPLPLQRRMVAENPCADVVELDTDHTPHLSMPDELAAALNRFAAM
jgi:pimeloyl-ACP methyl ester carboxylesterase